MSALPDAPALVDEATVRKFLGVIDEQAASALNGASRPGLLQLTRLSPHDKNVVISGRFEIGDVDGMVSVALADASAGHNVYVEPRTIAANTPRHARGGIEHTLGVFAFVIDSDADKGKAGRLTSAPSLEIETSPGNRHQWLFLDQALDAENAQPIGDLIRTATGADHCTGVIVQPYRVAGTPNYPNADKEAKGRTVAPTRILSATGQV